MNGVDLALLLYLCYRVACRGLLTALLRKQQMLARVVQSIDPCLWVRFFLPFPASVFGERVHDGVRCVVKEGWGYFALFFFFFSFLAYEKEISFRKSPLIILHSVLREYHAALSYPTMEDIHTNTRVFLNMPIIIC